LWRAALLRGRTTALHSRSVAFSGLVRRRGSGALQHCQSPIVNWRQSPLPRCARHPAWRPGLRQRGTRRGAPATVQL